MPLPYAEHSRVVVLGTSTYHHEDLPDRLQVRENVLALTYALTDSDFGIVSPAHCRPVLDATDQSFVVAALQQAAASSEDLLLFYYSGHGLIATRHHELYLALSNTDPESVASSAIPFDLVRDICLESPAKNRVVILDCCFSGRAINDTLAAGDSDILEQIPVSGAYTLTSTSGSQVAKAPQSSRHTAFTEHLLSILAVGIPNESELLTLGSIYRELRLRAKADGLPLPQAVGTETIGQLALAPNRSHPIYQKRQPHPLTPSLSLDAPLPQLAQSEQLGVHERVVYSPGLPVKLQEINGWVVVTPGGSEIDVYIAPILREEFIELLKKSKADAVVVDLHNVEYADSTGLGVLVGALKRIRMYGGVLRVAAPTERMLKIFGITGLTKVFPIYSSVAEACARSRLPDHLEGQFPPRTLYDRRPIDAYSQGDLVAIVRWVRSDGKERSPEEMLRDLVRLLGYSRTGTRIRAALECAIASERAETSGVAQLA